MLRRRRARASLTEYARYIEIPGAPVSENEDEENFDNVETELAAHHVLTLEAIQRCIEKPNGRLMLLMPPGSAKSTYGSVVAPSWIMGKIPNYRMIGVSYGSDMARKFGRRTRSIIKQKRYAALFDTGLSSESSAADEWALDNGSEYMSGGILSGITGNRADCLLETSMVSTDQGLVSIKDIVMRSVSCNVLSYEQDTGRLVYRPVEAVARSEAPYFYRVHTSAGDVVECTGDHRFYTSRGYVPARLLSANDVLLREMWSGHQAKRVPDEEARKTRPASDLLRSLVHAKRGKRKSWQNWRKMLGVWRYFSEVQQRWNETFNSLLLRGVQARFKAETNGGSCARSAGAPMQYMRIGVPPVYECNSGNVLFTELRKHRPFQKNAREVKSWMAEWLLSRPSIAACGAWFQGCKTKDQRTRRMAVRRLLQQNATTCASYQYGRDGQQALEFGNDVQIVPYDTSWRGERDTQKVSVSLVECVRKPATVYDIQVEGTRCFFANGILVHNCVVVDDPFKGRQDADSEVIRARTIAEYEESVLTRLKPGGSVIIINTRWHEGDLSGNILPERYNGESGIIRGRDGEDWEVICLAAKCERDDDPLGRKIGEYIWPEWFGPDHWAKFERLPRTWNALFQQRPAPDTGDYFKREWINLVDFKPAIETLSIYGGSDYAVTSDGGDYTVHAVIGVDHEGRLWLLDLWRQQASSDRWVDAFCDLVRKWKPIGWAEETGQIKSGVGPFLSKRMMETGSYVAREQFPTRGDKGVRAQSIRGRMALSGLFIHKDAPFVSDLISEMMSFPVGVHDDAVDAIALCGQLMDRMEMGAAPKAYRPPLEIGAIYAPELPTRRRR